MPDRPDAAQLAYQADQQIARYEVGKVMQRLYDMIVNYTFWASRGPTIHGMSVVVHPDTWRYLCASRDQRMGADVHRKQLFGMPVMFSYEVEPGHARFVMSTDQHPWLAARKDPET